MTETLSEDSYIPKYLSMKASEWTGSDGSRGYTFEELHYANYLDDATIIDAINKVRLCDYFWKLDKRAIEVSAAFAFNPKSTMGDREASITQINELIDKWEKEYREQMGQQL